MNYPEVTLLSVVFICFTVGVCYMLKILSEFVSEKNKIIADILKMDELFGDKP